MYSAWKKKKNPIELHSATNPMHSHVALINLEKAQEHHKKAAAYEYIHHYPAAETEWFEAHFFYTRALEDTYLEFSKKNTASLGVIRSLIKQRSYENALKKRENPELSPFDSSRRTEAANNYNDVQISIETHAELDLPSLQTIFSSNIRMLCTRMHLDMHVICDKTLSERDQLQLLTEAIQRRKQDMDTWLVSLNKQVEAIERVSQPVENTDLNTTLTTDTMSHASTPINSPTRITPSSSDISNSSL